MAKKMSPERVRKIKEELAGSEEIQLLDLAQDYLIRLSYNLSVAKQCIRQGYAIEEYQKAEIRQRCARVAVAVDTLKVRYGDNTEDVQEFLEQVEQCLE